MQDVIVELKALINLEDVYLAQANYLVAYDKTISLLINFGVRSLQFKKAFNPWHSTKIPVIQKILKIMIQTKKYARCHC